MVPLYVNKILNHTNPKSYYQWDFIHAFCANQQSTNQPAKKRMYAHPYTSQLQLESGRRLEEINLI